MTNSFWQWKWNAPHWGLWHRQYRWCDELLSGYITIKNEPSLVPMPCLLVHWLWTICKHTLYQEDQVKKSIKAHKLNGSFISLPYVSTFYSHFLLHTQQSWKLTNPVDAIIFTHVNTKHLIFHYLHNKKDFLFMP